MNRAVFSSASVWASVSIFLSMSLAPFAFTATKTGGLPSVEIDRVEVSGITAFGKSEIESALELTAGDRLERPKVVRTAENLLTLYRQRGYEDVQVNVSLAKDGSGGQNSKGEVVLQFVVAEGKPTRVANVKLTLSDAYWNQNLETLISKTQIKPGDLYDQEKISTAKRALQETLAGEEFIGAKVDEVKVSPGKDPSKDPGKVAEPTPGQAGGKSTPAPQAKWINLEFILDAGDRAKFGFRGNTLFTRGELMEFISDQRLVGIGKDYIAAIKKRIEEEYRTRGYSEVKVTSFVYEASSQAHLDSVRKGAEASGESQNERRITFDINEGRRLAISSVIFEGNVHYSDEELTDEYFEEASLLVQKKIYVEKDVQAAAEKLIEWMKSHGYLSSKLIAVNRQVQERTSSVGLVVYLYEGEQTQVRNLAVDGSSVLKPEEVYEILGLKSGQPLDLFRFTEGLETLKAAYRGRGYYDFKILNEDEGKVVLYSQDNRQADIELKFSEGVQYKVGRIEIEGLETTREEVIRRELDLKSGDVLEEPLIVASELKIRRLGIFSSVAIRMMDNGAEPNLKNLKVVVQEGTPGYVAGGAGYRQDLGVRAFGQTGYNNLFGRNEQLSFNLNTNYRALGGYFCDDNFRGKCFPEWQAQVIYVKPWFLGNNTFRPRLSAERTRYILFDVYSISAQATLERRLLQKPNLIGSLTYSLERTQQFDSKSGAVDDRTLTIGALIPSLKLDLRDNSLAPTKGAYFFTSFELADPALGSQSDPPVAYYRFQFRADGHIPISKKVQWFVSFRTGYARNNRKPPDGLSPQQLNAYSIPQVKQFAIGGVGSLRGFQEQEWNLFNYTILGTLAYVNYRTQLDLPFAGNLRFGPFLDAGTLQQDSYSFFSGIRFGSGFGFHYLSPVGPINFDYGFKLDPRPGESPSRFYFSIGIL